MSASLQGDVIEQMFRPALLYMPNGLRLLSQNPGKNTDPELPPYADKICNLTSYLATGIGSESAGVLPKIRFDCFIVIWCIDLNITICVL